MTLTTEELILNAADKIFTQKGFSAARMDDIANEAGINRALLHYYFRSKEKMFAMIFEKHFVDFFSGVARILSSDTGIFDKIKDIVGHELDILGQHPDIPIFVLGELSRNPERIINRLTDAKITPKIILAKLDEQLTEGYKAGILKNVKGISLIINIMGLCVYPFAARSVVQVFMGIGREEFLNYAGSRKDEIINFIIDGIKA